jgi:hypothetical protein
LRDVPLTEGLGADARVVGITASLTSLNFEVVVPVRAASVEQLPKTRCWIGQKEQRPPGFVLLDVDPFMWTDDHELLPRDGNDDMPEDDGSEWKPVGQLAASGQARPISDFQRAGGPLSTTPENQWHCGSYQANCRTREIPKQLRNFEPGHCFGV